MVYYFALLIILSLNVTVLGSQFWDDVDKLSEQLSDPQDKVTEPTPPAPQPSPAPNIILIREAHLNRKFYQKNVTLSAVEVEFFKLTITTDQSYPQNTSLAEIENKLLSKGRLHEWFDIDIYDVYDYTKYWGKVCLSLWGKPLVRSHKYLCTISPSYGTNQKRVLHIRENKLYLDLLFCKCHNYERNYRQPIFAAETFLIHKSDQNEFYIFDQTALRKDNRFILNIRRFQGGITLPTPLAVEMGVTKNSKSLEKIVTLSADDIDIFNRSLTIDKLYPGNISLAELENKLTEFGEIHEWPDLNKYNLNTYFMYWANLCVSLWGKHLDRSHRQSCVLLISYGIDWNRKLFIKGKTLHMDLLYCKCHSYILDFRQPVSNTDIFLIHESSANEFIVFEQRETGDNSYTLFIKDFKRMINLPNPEAFKGIF